MALLVVAFGVLGASLVGPRAAVANDGGRYQLGSSADGATFVLDSASGRVWRYDRTADAWYLYDLEALVKMPGEKGVRSQGPMPLPTAGAWRRNAEQEGEPEPDSRPVEP